MPERKKLKREIVKEALARMEDAARTVDDFHVVIDMWNHLDENRERRERDHEKQRSEQTLEVGYIGGEVFPLPVPHPAWQEVMGGDFLPLIFDNANELWQLIEDTDIALIVKNLSAKQKEILFFRVARICTLAQIACYKEQTERAVRKLLAAALDSIRDKLAPLIREQIETQYPQMTLAKREFISWYDKEKAVTIDSGGGE